LAAAANGQYATYIPTNPGGTNSAASLQLNQLNPYAAHAAAVAQESSRM
jgi:hypothetical protein